MSPHIKRVGKRKHWENPDLGTPSRTIFRKKGGPNPNRGESEKRTLSQFWTTKKKKKMGSVQRRENANSFTKGKKKEKRQKKGHIEGHLGDPQEKKGEEGGRPSCNHTKKDPKSLSLTGGHESPLRGKVHIRNSIASKNNKGEGKR